MRDLPKGLRYFETNLTFSVLAASVSNSWENVAEDYYLRDLVPEVRCRESEYIHDALHPKSVCVLELAPTLVNAWLPLPRSSGQAERPLLEILDLARPEAPMLRYRWR